jgi:sulfopyruvate decarboxylase TPP-binding subunit
MPNSKKRIGSSSATLYPALETPIHMLTAVIASHRGTNTATAQVDEAGRWLEKSLAKVKREARSIKPDARNSAVRICVAPKVVNQAFVVPPNKWRMLSITEGVAGTKG